MPIYEDAVVELGEADEYFTVEIDYFNVSINTNFDYKPRNADEFQGSASILLDNVNATWNIILFTA